MGVGMSDETVQTRVGEVIKKSLNDDYCYPEPADITNVVAALRDAGLLVDPVVEVGAYAQQKEATARAVNDAARMAQVAAKRTRELRTMTERAERAEAALAEAEQRHRDLVSRLGFGDNITEPMADNDTIVAWFDQQGAEAIEWRESQAWRIDCELAGHPQDDDCRECDPAFAEQRGARRVVEAVEEYGDIAGIRAARAAAEECS